MEEELDAAGEYHFAEGIGRERKLRLLVNASTTPQDLPHLVVPKLSTLIQGGYCFIKN